jgi:hypothetical protein
MKAFVLFSLIFLSVNEVFAREGAYRCESIQDELILQAHVSRTTDGDLEIWFDDDLVELVDNSWFGPELEVVVRLTDSAESTLICTRY